MQATFQVFQVYAIFQSVRQRSVFSLAEYCQSDVRCLITTTTTDKAVILITKQIVLIFLL